MWVCKLCTENIAFYSATKINSRYQDETVPSVLQAVKIVMMQNIVCEAVDYSDSPRAMYVRIQCGQMVLPRVCTSHSYMHEYTSRKYG